MSVFDNNSPAQGHAALSDIDQIRVNLNALRDMESSLSTAPPSNPVAGQFWWATDTKVLYQRTQANTSWVWRWSEADPPAKSSDLTNHINTNITSAVAVHGIKQGSGNGLDADKVDGYHASSFSAVGHTHGGGDVISAVANATYAASAGNSDTIDGYHAGSFSFAGHTHSGGDLSDATVTLAKLKMARGGWSSAYNVNNSTPFYAIFSINAYSHSPILRLVHNGTDSGNTLTASVSAASGASVSLNTTGDTGQLQRMSASVSSTSVGTIPGTVYAYWDYHTN